MKFTLTKIDIKQFTRHVVRTFHVRHFVMVLGIAALGSAAWLTATYFALFQAQLLTSEEIDLVRIQNRSTTVNYDAFESVTQATQERMNHFDQSPVPVADDVFYPAAEAEVIASEEAPQEIAQPDAPQEPQGQAL